MLTERKVIGKLRQIEQRYAVVEPLAARLDERLAAAWETNLLEENRRPMARVDGALELALRPFETKTLYLKGAR